MNLKKLTRDCIPDYIIKKHQEQERLAFWQIGNMEKFMAAHKAYRLPFDPRIARISFRSSGVRVMLVDVKRVKIIYSDFTEGGHGYRYLFVPLGEIWIANNLPPDSYLPTVWHELVERILMKKGLNYEEAHDFATMVEMDVYDRGKEPRFAEKILKEISF